MTDSTGKLTELIFEMHRLMRENLRHSSGFDLMKFLRLQALHFVAARKSPTMKNVSDYLCVTPPSATSFVNSLVKAGHLKRERDESDRRIVRLAVTAAGQRLIAKKSVFIRETINSVLDNLTESEKSSLIKIIGKITKIYEK